MQIMKILKLILVLFCTICYGSGLKILAVFPTPSKSHTIVGVELLKGLAAKGHEVTMFSLYPQSKPIKNYRDLVFDGNNIQEAFTANIPTQNLFNYRKEFSPLTKFKFIQVGADVSDAALANKNMKKLLNSDEKFDAVIIQAFLTEPLLAIAKHFNATSIAFSTVGASFFTNHLVGNPSPLAYVPELTLGYTPHMNFKERLLNTISYTAITFLRTFIVYPRYEEIHRKHFPNLPDIQSIIANTSLVLANSHFSLQYPKPLNPNVVEIGGFHVGAPQPLPEDLKKYMDEAKHGVIYFSLGSNLKSVDMPVDMKNTILRVFGELKQNVLWKWEDEVLDNKPSNVKISKWFPQTDILAHPNLKLFITHGGWGSVTEAKVRGVPILGIPIFADQNANMNLVEKQGCGLQLDLENITYTSLSWAINEMLNNDKYAKNMKLISEHVNDQEMKPMDRAIYWIEYVVRTKGAPHLRSASLDLNLAQLLLLDVVAFLLAIFAIICLVIYLSIKLICKLICKRKNQTKKKED